MQCIGLEKLVVMVLIKAFVMLVNNSTTAGGIFMNCMFICITECGISWYNSVETVLEKNHRKAAVWASVFCYIDVFVLCWFDVIQTVLLCNY